jgi:hypothetical protein
VVPQADAGPVTPPERASADPGTVDVSRGTGARSLGVLIPLVLLVLTAGACYLAWLERSPVTFGVAALLTVVTFAAVSRPSGGSSRATIEGGVLDLRTHDSHHRFDLASPRTELEVLGSPRDRRWKVLVHRTGLSPYIIDGATVDPVRFTEALETLRADA